LLKDTEGNQEPSQTTKKKEEKKKKEESVQKNHESLRTAPDIFFGGRFDGVKKQTSEKREKFQEFVRNRDWKTKSQRQVEGAHGTTSTEEQGKGGDDRKKGLTDNTLKSWTKDPVAQGGRANDQGGSENEGSSSKSFTGRKRTK